MITLTNGIQVNIDGFWCDSHYSGVLLGWPDEERHEEIIKDAVKRVGEHLRDHPYVHLVRPSLMPYMEGYVRVPWYVCGVYLVGPEYESKGGVGSHLVVAFFSDDAMTRSPEQVVQESLAHLDWEKLSVGYYH